ncbi:hypothetical protein [Fibrobacter sp. UWB12]|uniref:hypothetical protein n=1 Tax=Fibrobacter sp. UWB12 TaxID=1896203 RepID=UPI00091FE58A|nr:hypothetical protein [Fibrobacter sp. UWB12]SHK58374.1 hypothetical protein SAMN05720759_10439 [Fibrobacter sp. UWB12]
MRLVGQKISIALLALSFAGCAGSNQNGTPQSLHRQPLDESVEVSIIPASIIPIIPEKAEHVNTLLLSGSASSNEEGFKTVARKQGANFVFVKKTGEYYGATASVVDLYYLPEEAHK